MIKINKKLVFILISISIIFICVGCGSNSETTTVSISRSDLDWRNLHKVGEQNENDIIPKDYKFDLNSEECIQLSLDNYKENSKNYLQEKDMLKFILNNYLPADCKLVKSNKHFVERPRSNSSDTEVSEYIYKSNATGIEYQIEFDYYYSKVKDSTEEKLDSKYTYATVHKITKDK